MTIADLTSPAASTIFPASDDVANAMEKWVNANGGINGRPLDVINCDGQTDPNKIVSCARQAVSEKVVAVLGAASNNAGKVMPLLENAGIPLLGTTGGTPAETTSKYSFPLNAGLLLLTAMGQLAGQQCQTPGTVTFQSPAEQLIAGSVVAGIGSTGKANAYTISLPPAATDSSSAALQASQKGDCAILALTPALASSFVPALRQVSKQPVIGSPTSLPSAVLKKLGGSLDGSYSTSYTATANSPAMAPYRDIVGKYSDTSKYDISAFEAINVYAAYRVFADVARAIKGDITAPTVFAALNADSKVDTYGATPTLDFTAAGEWTAVPSQIRIFNRSVVYVKIEKGEQQQLGGFNDLSKVGALVFNPPKK